MLFNIGYKTCFLFYFFLNSHIDVFTTMVKHSRG